MGLLHTTFQDCIITRNGTQNWPPTSCDLTPLDFFLSIKSKVRVNKPQTIEELKKEIRTKIVDVDQDLCERVLRNFVEQVDVCRRARRGHIPDIMFHTRIVDVYSQNEQKKLLINSFLIKT